MRKFTLFFMSLFLAVGAMAQEPVVTITPTGNAPYKVSDEDAAKIFNLENLTVLVDVTTTTLSGRGAFFCVADPAQPVPSSFSGTNTSFMACGHVNAVSAYLAAAKDGQHFSTGAIPSNTANVKLAYVFDITNNKFKIYVNGSNVMDRNFGTYEIASPKMVKADFANANIYIGGGMAGNAAHEICDGTVNSVSVYNGVLTADQIFALSVDEDFVVSYEQLESGKVYTFESQRGWLMATSGTDFVYNSSKLTNANASKENANCQWVLYSTDNGNYLYNVGVNKFISVNKSNANSIPLSAAPTTAAVEFKASSLTAYPIILGVEGYAINHNTSNGAFTYGALLWKDGWTQDAWLNDAGSCHKVTYIEDASAEMLNTIKERVLNYELKGNYIRLKGASGNYIDASSIYNNANATTGQMSMKSNEACNLAGTIFYLDNESHLLNYAKGTYTKDTREIGGIGAAKSVWSFSISPRDSEKLMLADTNTSGSKHLHDSEGNRADKCSSVCGVRHDFTVEIVESLPVTITAAKYATFYAPVAVEVADGVTAYTATVDAANNRVELNEVRDVIPANTGVVLYSETAGTYNFAITTTDATVASDLRGSAAATYYTEAGTYYALGQVDGVVAFYKDAFNNNRFQNNSHKAYLYVANASETASYSFRFGDGTTGIDEITEQRAESKDIYDLTGRRVEAITAPGIYIVNGVKRVVR
ncbi:MAG: hypothetical protein IKV07_02850 [Bacteroidaceae bacterium]|nr:hypothetical protein [Bacteroidaceae bacterium]